MRASKDEMLDKAERKSNQHLSLAKRATFSASHVGVFVFAELWLNLLGVDSINATHDPFVGFDNNIEQFITTGSPL